MTDVNDSDIAIVGMAIRVPDAANPQQFWANLKGGVESARHYTDEELAEFMREDEIDPKLARQILSEPQLGGIP